MLKSVGSLPASFYESVEAYGILTYYYSPGGVLKSEGSLLATSFCESVEASGTLTYYYTSLLQEG